MASTFKDDAALTAAKSILENVYRAWVNRECDSACDLLDETIEAIANLNVFNQSDFRAWEAEDNDVDQER